MKSLLTLLLLLPALAFAQIDPDPDGIGIYFDSEATVTTATAASGETVSAYLIATGMSQTGNIYLWDAFVWTDFEGQDTPYITGTCINAFNTAMNMPGSPGYHFTALAYGGPGLPAEPITILAELSIHVEDSTLPVNLFVGDEAEYWMSGEPPYHVLTPSSGSGEAPVAIINGGAPVATTARALADVKALYR